jgi:hypothetical protein
MGQCYDHNVLQFLTIVGEQIGIFIKNCRRSMVLTKNWHFCGLINRFDQKIAVSAVRSFKQPKS